MEIQKATDNAEKVFSSESSKESLERNPVFQHFVLGLLPCRTMRQLGFCCPSHLVCSVLLQQLYEMNTIPLANFFSSVLELFLVVCRSFVAC